MTYFESAGSTMPARRLININVKPIDRRLRCTQISSRNSRHAAAESSFFFAAVAPAAARSAERPPPPLRSARRMLGAPDLRRAIVLIESVRNCQGERSDAGFECFAGRRHHRVLAVHRAHGRLEVTKAVVV